jgi:hypothetical protein
MAPYEGAPTFVSAVLLVILWSFYCHCLRVIGHWSLVISHSLRGIGH